MEIVPTSDEPIELLPPTQRLGTLVQRYRVDNKVPIKDVAERLGVSETVVHSVESFRAPLKAEQLMELSILFRTSPDLLLDAARDFHRGIWEKNNQTPGYQLEEMESKVTSVTPSDVELEQTAVDVVHQCAGTAAVMRETAKVLQVKADELLGQAKRLQDLLVDRGVLQDRPEPEVGTDGTVEGEGPHDPFQNG